MLICSMSVSVDGFIADRDGAFGWTVPSDELFRFHLAQVRELGRYLAASDRTDGAAEGGSSSGPLSLRARSERQFEGAPFHAKQPSWGSRLASI